MADDINCVTLTGRVSQEPDLRSTVAGTSVLSFCVAVGSSVRPAQGGEWERRTDYVDCAVLGRRADALAPYLAKGQRVAVTGALRHRSWTDAQGVRRSKDEVLVSSLVLPDRGGPSIARDSATSAQGPAPAPTRARADFSPALQAAVDASMAAAVTPADPEIPF